MRTALVGVGVGVGLDRDWASAGRPRTGRFPREGRLLGVAARPDRAGRVPEGSFVRIGRRSVAAVTERRPAAHLEVPS
ncbi:hypothetical protein ACFWFF_02690 [Streptomyces sp. NPDC060223]|uniref:hypothetical protein n=1 Tax=unclassified Streptomyces TaxID=2593676 RepID=UPI00363E0B27